jgi:hypothetical protein
LSQSPDSFDEYLELYDSSWNDLSQYSSGPVDYGERTLYSTWNMSFERVRDQDPTAAELLKLMAYLDNQYLCYGLFLGGAGDAPAWWVDVLKSQARFKQAMSTLHNYSLLGVSEEGYTLHTCVHDWTLEYLNREINQERCGIALRCVAARLHDRYVVHWLWEPFVRAQALAHARRFQYAHLRPRPNALKLLDPEGYVNFQVHVATECAKIIRS